MEDKDKIWKLFPVRCWTIESDRRELEDLLNTGEWDIHSIATIPGGSSSTGSAIYNLRRVNQGVLQVKGEDIPEA